MQAVGDLYTIPQENLDFCAMIGQLARERIAPRSAEIDERAEYPWDIRKLLSEQDVLGLPFPVEYGGTGTGTLMLNMAVEELAKVDASCALILMVQELGTLPLQLYGSEELKDRGVTVNAILPGTIDTPRNRLDMADADFSRWVAPQAIAEVITFLASDAARAVTGAAIPIFGRG